MSKMIFLALSLLLNTQAHALGEKLTALECVAQNGTVISSNKKASFEGYLRVASHWGYFTKNFTAKMSLVSQNTESYIGLMNDDGIGEYVIALKMDPSLTTLQTAYGMILRTNPIKSMPPTPLTLVRCDVQLSL